MKILNVHGYNGSPKNSAYTALCELGFTDDVISPSLNYDELAPLGIIKSLELITKYKNVDMVIGTSLGGFFAAVLASRLRLPAILINPCLMPFYELPKFGYYGDISGFIHLFGDISIIDKANTAVIIGADDEVISTHDFTKEYFKSSFMQIIPGGKHSGATLPLKDFFSEAMPLLK